MSRCPCPSVPLLCLHLFYLPRSWGSAKILKNGDNYDWVTCSEPWRSGPEVSIIVRASSQSRYYWYLKPELKMHPASNTSWIGKNNFVLKKRPVELKCQIDFKTIIFAGIRHGDHQELGSHSLGVSSVASLAISWQYLLYSKLSFNSFLAHSDCYDLISHQWRSVWLWLQWSQLHPTTSPMTRTRQLWIARHTNAI